MLNKLDEFFNVTENQSTIKREIIAGLTVFFTAAYIIIVNPLILKDAGIPIEMGLLATILVSVAGTLLMGFFGKAPIIQIPGMGVNAFFTYTIVQSAGLTAAQALACVFISGILFLLITLSPLTKALEKGIPDSLKHGITAGIGLFLAFIGLQKGELVVSSSKSFVALGSLNALEPLLTLLGVILIGALYIRKIKGSFIIGMGIISIAHFFLSKNPSAEAIHLNKSVLSKGLLNLDFSHVFTSAFFLSVFSLTMLIVFENMGLLYGMLPDIKRFPQAYRSAAASTILSSLFGTSPTISAAESASGIEEGGRTGLTAIVAGFLFIGAFFIIPFISYIPNSAIAPILIILGGIMMQNVKWIPFHDFSESFPAFLIILLIPMTYSIADGLAFGFIAYPLFKILLGKRKHVSPVLYIIAFLFLLHFIALSLIS